MPYDIRILTQKPEMLSIFPLFSQLNPKVSEIRFSNCLDDMVPRGYRIVAVFDGEICVGISGIWTATKFYSGKYFELDNVVVHKNHRSEGIGKLMCDFIENLALKEGVETLMLDAYRENHKAHIFYEREGFFPRGYHFVKLLGEWPQNNLSRLPEKFSKLDEFIRSIDQI